MIFKPNEIPKCPHCKGEMEGEAKDYVIPGREGEASRAYDDHYECEGRFSAVLLPDGNIGFARA
jgi:hypothetical protein